MEKQLKAAVYLRVSTEEQVSGYGLDVQRERCRAQAIAKGWLIAGEYTDEGISGTKDENERPGLAALLEACNEGMIDAVIVLALDRLGRKTRIVLSLVDKLTARGIALVSCKESLDTATPQGQFVLTMFAALAQLERDVIVERTTAGRNERGKKDGERGGRLPLGYIRTVDGLIDIDHNWTPTVRLIFDLRRSGKTYRAIADVLTSVNRRYGGKRWYASTVRSVINNYHKYAGGNRGESNTRWLPILD